MDDSLQPTVDMLLNLSIFMWFGAVCPWRSFVHNDVIPIYRLIFLGILVLLLRRLPIVLAMHKGIHQIEQFSQAAFVGFFGPMGVGAIFYLTVCRDFLKQSVLVDGKPREDAAKVADAVEVVVWFLVICSIVCYLTLVCLCFPIRPLTTIQVVHGISVPLAKAGYHIPRTISSALSTSTSYDPEPITIPDARDTHSTATRGQDRSALGRNRRERVAPAPFRIGGSVIRPKSPASQLQPGIANDEPERPVNLVSENGQLKAGTPSSAV